MKQDISKNQAWELMQKSITGDEEAFGLLYQAYFSPIYRYIYFRVQNKAVAEDITQAVFLKVFEKLPQYRDRQRPPLAYLFTVARNKVIDHWRKNKFVEPLADRDNLNQLPDYSDGPEGLVSRTLAVSEISRGLENISQEQREVIIAKYINEKTYAEIAQATGKNEAAVRKIASRGLNQLRKYFKKRGVVDL